MIRKNKMVKRWGQENDSRQVLRKETAAGTLRNLRAARSEAQFLRRVTLYVKRHAPELLDAARKWASTPAPSGADTKET